VGLAAAMTARALAAALVAMLAGCGGSPGSDSPSPAAPPVEDRFPRPYLVKDIRPGSESSAPYALTDARGVLFFGADDGLHGKALWKSDGTSEGTLLVKNVDPGGLVASASERRVFFETIVLKDTPGFRRWPSIWTSDGSEEGTLDLLEFYPCGDGGGGCAKEYYPHDMRVVGGLAFFDGNYDLWRTDGTVEGTGVLSRGANFDYPRFAAAGRFLYFSMSMSGRLARTDGTPTGTMLLRADVTLGAAAAVGETLFFVTTDGSKSPRVPELWKSDGTPEGTVRVHSFPAGSPQSLTAARPGLLFFALATSPAVTTAGYEIWRSDGTSAGTFRVLGGLARPLALAAMGGDLYFSANDGVRGAELFRSDGQRAFLVDDINAQSGAEPQALTPAGRHLFFVADDGVHGRELWRTDGTAAGTVLVHDFAPGLRSSNPGRLAASGSRLFFTVDDGVSGVELWAVGLSR